MLTLILVLVTTWWCNEGDAAPQISAVPAANRRTLFMEPARAVPGPEKNYTGIRMLQDSNLMAYHHEQTIAVVELDKNRELLNCELLEVKTSLDKKVALAVLAPKVPRRLKITFADMKNLMQLCQKLDLPNSMAKRFTGEARSAALQDSPRGFSSIFSGVFPGTKWCGTGDIAGSYFDIGTEKAVDKCCRTHDLCPVKVAAFKTQYGITNYAPYTRSHCDCDNNFYRCLKKVQTPTADLLGSIFFNVGQVTCVEDLAPQTRGAKPTKRFRVIDKRF